MSCIIEIVRYTVSDTLMLLTFWITSLTDINREWNEQHGQQNQERFFHGCTLLKPPRGKPRGIFTVRKFLIFRFAR